jgi:S-adenosylmethionine decarboxylase
MDFHSLANDQLINNYKTWVRETRPEELKKLMDAWLTLCDFQVLNFTEHYFKPYGYTCLWLLGESHLAIHTFPEKELCYVELSSCNADKNQLFQSLLHKHFSGSPAE